MAIREPARVTAVLGPTNTGKTHLAIERLCAHSSGIMGFPLRLLAREVYDRVVAIKGPNEIGLITGEEKIMPPGARWILSTVESMPLDRDVAFVAIDESQLGADPERGHIFTDRILNSRGREETMILGSDSLKPLVRSLVPEAEIISRPRFSSLEYAGSKKLTRLPPKSAIIGFSADEVYAAAELLRRTHGGAAVVMGALSPGTRNAQVALYQSGEVDYIVATDAIGMGLNLDIGHICFAGLTKFDGKRRRRLTVAELAQIAGRAGRHHRNGTFGTASGFGPVPELTPDEIERIENHRFRPLDHLFWRNTDLDLSNPTALLASLSDLPDKPGLRLSPRAVDEEVLDLLVSHPSIAARRWNEADMSRLWSACRVPDFMKRGAEFHAGFVARLWDHLGKGNCTIPTQWIATELARLDSVQGDIDTLSTRIAAARSWAFIAHQADWVDDPPHWAARTQDLEAKLSDALHKKLTERFVDRRARLLRARDGELALNVRVTVNDEEVALNGEAIGKLAGFEFRPDPAANHAEHKALVAAAEDKLRPELAHRAAQLAAAKNGEFSLTVDDKGQALICWHDAPVARLSKGRSLLDPMVILLPSLRLLTASDREKVLRRVSQWLRSRIDQKMGRLRWLSHAARSPDHPPAIRAILAALADGLGHCDREKLADAVQDLLPAQRHWLRTAGVTIGPLDLYIEALLKPGVASMSLLLRCVADGRPVLTPPMAGLGIIDKPSAQLAEAARITGYRTFGDQMIRIDLVNRIALDLHKQRSGSDHFLPDAKLATSMGIGVVTMNRVLRSLGFRPANTQPGQWRWRGLNRPKIDTRPINPSFAVLASLKKA